MIDFLHDSWHQEAFAEVALSRREAHVFGSLPRGEFRVFLAAHRCYARYAGCDLRKQGDAGHVQTAVADDGVSAAFFHQADDRARDDLHGRIAGGVEVPFTWHNSAIGLEYVFLSDGASDPDEYIDRALTLYPDDLYYLGRHYLGLTAGGEIIPILYANVISLFNVLDPSGLVAVTLLYSIADEAEFVGGFFIPWGKKPGAVDAGAGEPSIPEIRGEFGMVPYLIFMETRFTF